MRASRRLAALLTNRLCWNWRAGVWCYRNGVAANNCRSGHRRDVQRQIGCGFLLDRVAPGCRGSVRDAGLEVPQSGVGHCHCPWTGVRACGRRTASARNDGRRRISRSAKAPPGGRRWGTPRRASCESRHRVRRCTKSQRNSGLTHAAEATPGRRGGAGGTHSLRKSPQTDCAQ